MLAQKTKIEQEADAAQLPSATKLEVVTKSLADFAASNGISLEGFKTAFIAKNPNQTVPVAPPPPQRNCRAEAEAKFANAPRILRNKLIDVYIAKCRGEGGAFNGGDAFAFSFADDTYDLFA